MDKYKKQVETIKAIQCQIIRIHHSYKMYEEKDEKKMSNVFKKHFISYVFDDDNLDIFSVDFFDVDFARDYIRDYHFYLNKKYIDLFHECFVLIEERILKQSLTNI